MRTIVDILKRGNLELFHSSMVAWLIDSKGEHGKGTSVLAKLAETLSPKRKRMASTSIRRSAGKWRRRGKDRGKTRQSQIRYLVWNYHI